MKKNNQNKTELLNCIPLMWATHYFNDDYYLSFLFKENEK